MTHNIFYEITQKKDRDTDGIHDIEAYVDEIVNDDYSEENSSRNEDPSRIAAVELDYMTNYNVKMLSHILDYYKLSKRKLNKTEMVQIIVIFEDDPTNEVIVATRRQLWKYIERLREDEYLSKFVIFDGV
jgi:hypothetical protein